MSAAWFWLVVLLVLPNCSLHEGGTCPCPNFNFNPGPEPKSSAIFCDIEKMGTGFDNTARVCASSADSATASLAIPLTSAALALNTGQTQLFGLDKSTDAVNRCGADGEIVKFQGSFPQGLAVCLNCGSQIPSVYADANAACVAKCDDISTTTPTNPPTMGVATFCGKYAHVSTNFPVSGCPSEYSGACTTAGAPNGFMDPRQLPEPVAWTDLVGVSPGGAFNNDLTRSAATTTNFDAGAASTPMQWITKGDAYVEFSAAENNLSHVIGFSQISTVTDSDPSLTDINFAISLNANGLFYIFKGGIQVPGTFDVSGSFGAYAKDDRFRITVTDRWDGNADVTYSKMIGSCTPGVQCNQMGFGPTTDVAQYPLRVDTSFREQAAKLQDVRVVRIKE